MSASLRVKRETDISIFQFNNRSRVNRGSNYHSLNGANSLSYQRHRPREEAPSLKYLASLASLLVSRRRQHGLFLTIRYPTTCQVLNIGSEFTISENKTCQVTWLVYFVSCSQKMTLFSFKILLSIKYIIKNIQFKYFIKLTKMWWVMTFLKLTNIDLWQSRNARRSGTICRGKGKNRP